MPCNCKQAVISLPYIFLVPYIFRLLNTSSLLCDCQLKWLPHWLFHSRLQDTVNVICAHPEWLAGRSILSVNTEDFVCGLCPLTFFKNKIMSSYDEPTYGPEKWLHVWIRKKNMTSLTYPSGICELSWFFTYMLSTYMTSPNVGSKALDSDFRGCLEHFFLVCSVNKLHQSQIFK